MIVYTVHAAKSNLSRLIEHTCAGEEVIIARNNEPVVRLVPVKQQPKRQFGSMKGRVIVHDSFFDPMSDEELEAWGMR